MCAKEWTVIPMSARLHVAICVPTFRGAVMSETTTSLVTLAGLLISSGIGYDFVTLQATEVSAARNMMATKVLRERDISHLLFVDDDIGFDPETVLELLRARAPVIGCVYPKRQISLARFHQAAQAGASIEAATGLAQDYVAHHLRGQQIVVKDGLCEVESLGMGLTLIHREALEGMLTAGAVRARPSPVQPDALGNSEIYGFFDPIHDPAADIWFSEDVSFCRRWREQCGGKVMALVAPVLAHVGHFAYAGSYAARLKASAT